jgi:pimeloyl-ACP methyl ester carboxylesterase
MFDLPPAVSDTMPGLGPAGAGCPPPLRCRQIAELFEQQASAWDSDGSPVGTHGWCWGAGPPIYLLNAVGVPARLGVLLAWLLREDHRCVLIDWRAPSPRQRLTLDDYAADFVRLLESAEESAVTVLGGSFGGAVALRAAARRPELFGRIVLQGVASRRTLTLMERWLMSGLRRSARTQGTLPGRERIETLNHRRWFPPLDPDRWAWYLETTGAVPAALYAAQSQALHRDELTSELPRIATPVLAIDAEGVGPTLRAAQLRLQQAIPGARTVRMHTTGYHPGLTHPHRLAKVIRQFETDPAWFDAPPTEPEFFPLNPSTIPAPAGAACCHDHDHDHDATTCGP